MAKILQACDALNEAKDVNSGFGALAALMASAAENDAPPMKEVSEIIGALHHRMCDHLTTIERCLEG